MMKLLLITWFVGKLIMMRGCGFKEMLAGHHHLAGCLTHLPAGFMATYDLLIVD